MAMLKGTAKDIVAENVRTAKAAGMSERDAVLVSMKRTKTEAKKRDSGLCSPCEPSEQYPYGLTVRLENDSLDKLGIEELPGVGDTMKLVAEVTVESASQSSRLNGEPRRDISLQITKMSLE